MLRAAVAIPHGSYKSVIQLRVIVYVIRNVVSAALSSVCPVENTLLYNVCINVL